MKISTFIGVVAFCIAATLAEQVQKESPTTAPSTPEQQQTPQFQEEATVAPAKEIEVTPPPSATIEHGEVVLFKQPEPASATEKAAIKFKPQLSIANGCVSYAAVYEAGQVSTWLKGPDHLGIKCAGLDGLTEGSQVYGRSAWYGRVWGIMSAWFFPEMTPVWQHLIVWTNNPNVSEQTIVAVSTSTNGSSGYAVQTPPSADKINGTSVKVS
ncbi:unnamed protein product [Phytophthora lilii]|uniref:Unnamed protein product n=1 Tax=Phytophthora lilii TaxID=2077276 RepID=A0A9W6UDP9_9STRA|nr:unnamed protein product [Phytophthora lilii]